MTNSLLKGMPTRKEVGL